MKRQPPDYITPNLVCPFCGYKMDRSTPVTNRQGKGAPAPGDVSLCIQCGHAGVFTKDGLRKPTGEEMLRFATDKVIIEGQILIAGIKRL